MADIKNLVTFISRWEGGFVNDPVDKGGPTHMGVTLAIWQRVGYDKNGDGVIDVDDLKLLTHEDLVEVVLRPHFWNVWKADDINNQATANLVVDWMWHSGPRTIPMVQNALQVKEDGIVGPLTLQAFNDSLNKEWLFSTIKQSRIMDVNRICSSNTRMNRFRKGWLDRIASHRFIPVIVCLMMLSFWSCRGTKDTNSSSHAQQVVATEVSSSEQERVALESTEVLTAKDFSDSVQETMVMLMTMTDFPDAGNVAPSGVQVYGKAVVTRNRWARTQHDRRAIGATSTVQTDSTTNKMEQFENTNQQASILPASKPKRWGAGMVAAVVMGLLLLWLFNSFRKLKV